MTDTRNLAVRCTVRARLPIYMHLSEQSSSYPIDCFLYYYRASTPKSQHDNTYGSTKCELSSHRCQYQSDRISSDMKNSHQNYVDTGRYHLALVFERSQKQHIWSRSLNEINVDETEIQRKIRGAFEVELAESLRQHSLANDVTSVLTRIHSSCFTGETLASARCDCGDQLERSIEAIYKEGCGVIVYLQQEGRGIGLEDKLRAYNLQDMGYDTVAANKVLNHPTDGRDYILGCEILRDLGIKSLRLLTNNPDKVRQVQNYGLSVFKRIPILPKTLAHLENRSDIESVGNSKYTDLVLAESKDPNCPCSTPLKNEIKSFEPSSLISASTDSPNRKFKEVNTERIRSADSEDQVKCPAETLNPQESRAILLPKELRAYLETKVRKMGHFIDLSEIKGDDF